MKRIEIIILSIILVIAFVVRLYKISRPLADWHSWRQADTASVARNFIKEGFNPFLPKYDDMSSQANGLDNPNRYRFVEFPIYNGLIALVWRIAGVDVTSARLVTVFITLGSIVFLYLLVRHFSGWQTAALASFFFATIPYNVFYSSTILPAPLMVLAILGLYYSFARWQQEEKTAWFWAILSVFFANVAILAWPIAFFFVIPIVYLAFSKYGFSMFKKISLWIFTLVILIPFIAWRVWMSQFPEGIPNWQFLLNADDIRFKGAFFRWLIAERIGKLILSVSGFFLLVLGFLKKPENKERLFYFSWLASIAVYFAVFASGNIRHDYYQIPIIPVLAVFLAKGTRVLFDLPSKYFIKILGPSAAVILIISMYSFGFFEVRGFYWINKPQIIAAGRAADRLLSQDATVIAPYNGDAAFLYQTNRHGYPIVDRPLEKFIDEGTKYLISVDVEDSGIQKLAEYCKVVEKKPDYLIIEMFEGCVGR